MVPIVARQADIVQVRPPPIIEAEPMVTPRDVVMELHQSRWRYRAKLQLYGTFRYSLYKPSFA